MLKLRRSNVPPAFWISVTLLLFLDLFAEVHDLVVRRVRRSIPLQHLHINPLISIFIPLFFHLFLCSLFKPCLLRKVLFGVLQLMVFIRTCVFLLDVVLLAAEPLGKLLAVPHQQLLIGLHRSDGVEVDVPAVLARHQVLFGQRASWVDITHPVAPVDVIAINKVLKLPTAVNLCHVQLEIFFSFKIFCSFRQCPKALLCVS